MIMYTAPDLVFVKTWSIMNYDEQQWVVFFFSQALHCRNVRVFVFQEYVYIKDGIWWAL